MRLLVAKVEKVPQEAKIYYTFAKHYYYFFVPSLFLFAILCYAFSYTFMSGNILKFSSFPMSYKTIYGMIGKEKKIHYYSKSEKFLTIIIVVYLWKKYNVTFLHHAISLKYQCIYT